MKCLNMMCDRTAGPDGWCDRCRAALDERDRRARKLRLPRPKRKRLQGVVDADPMHPMIRKEHDQ